MFSKEVLDLLIQVVSSWQVLAVTVVIALYFLLVSYVARLYHRPRVSRAAERLSPRPKKAKDIANAMPEVSEDDNLGLTEA